MTLAPQKAKAQKKQTSGRSKKKGVKRDRRIAPEFTLVWSPEATDLVYGRSSELIKKVYTKSYARIYRAEAALCGAIDIVTIVPIDPIDSFDQWWAPFDVEDLSFVLQFHDKPIREYELVPYDGREPEEPTLVRRQKTPTPKRIAPPQRPRKTGATGSLPAATKKHPKKTDAKRELEILYRFARRSVSVAERAVTNKLAQLKRRIKPRLLRSLVHLMRISGNGLHALRDVVAPVVQTGRELRAFAFSLRTSFTAIAQLPAQTVSRGATLVPRSVGQNFGLSMLLYSWSWDDVPCVDWSQSLFGVDWTDNLFGVLPEEERAFR